MKTASTFNTHKSNNNAFASKSDYANRNLNRTNAVYIPVK